MILKKIFSSSKGKTGESSEKKRRERAPRVRISALHNIFFIPKENAVGAKVKIANISVTGVGLLRESSQNWPDAGAVIAGHFEVNQAEKVPVEFTVVHASEKVIGGQFRPPADPVRKLVNSYFKYEVMALDMALVDPKLLKEEKDGKSHLFRGDNNCELFFIEHEGQIRRYTFTFFGNIMEWSEGRPVKFGYMVFDMKATGNWGYSGADPIRWVTTIPKDTIEVSLKFLENIEQLLPQHKGQIAKTISSLTN